MITRTSRPARTLAALLALAVAIAGGPGRSHADDGDADDREAEASVAVVVAGSDGSPLAPAIQATVQVSMERALKRDPRLAVIDQDDRLAARAHRVPQDAVAEGLAQLEAGETLLRRGKVKLALLKLQGASVQLARVLAWTSKQDLARAQLLLGSAQAMAGDHKGALATFTALQVWRSDAVPDADLGPKQTLPVWEEAHDQVQDADRGAIDIESSPEGAMAYVDGRLVGFTPTLASGLPVGTHYVTIRREGFERRVEPVRVGTRMPFRLSVVLMPSDGARDLSAARTVFAAGIDSPELVAEARAGLRQIADLIEVDQVVLVRPGKKDGRYTAAVYDTDGGARLASIDIKVGQRDLETAFAAAAAELYAQVVKIEHTRRRGPPHKGQFHVPAFVHRPWFWGAAAAVVVTAIAVPLILSGDSAPPGCPSGNSCGQVLFRF